MTEMAGRSGNLRGFSGDISNLYLYNDCMYVLSDIKFCNTYVQLLMKVKTSEFTPVGFGLVLMMKRIDASGH